MVTSKTQYILNNVRGYSEEPLCFGEYYRESQRGSEEWAGLGSLRLGLAGRVHAEDFLQL